ncbi:MAG: tetratricopeptide repeat protein [Pirellulales bacterium]
MDAPGKWTYLWPGLTRAWGAGEFSGLVAAIVFAVLLNAALIATFTDHGGMQTAGIATLWGGALAFWLVSARNSHQWRMGRNRLPKQDECDRQFVAAQTAYLRGHWPEAEGTLRQLLEARPDDIEGRLLLATLLRRLERYTEAKEQLEDLAKREGAQRWSTEMRQEWRLCQPQDAVRDD